MNKKPMVLCSPALVCLLAGSAFAGETSATPRAWSGSADEVRALVSEIMADADTRSSLLAPGGTSGHDGKNFFLASDDGSWRLNIGGYVHFRYYLNWRDDNGGEEDFESGFQTTRTRIILDGTVATNVFYYIHGGFSRSTGNFTLLDAYGGYKWDNGWYMKFGQFKLPFSREELVGDVYQLAADRSLTQSIFGQGRTTAGRSQGIELGWKGEDFRCALAFSDGFSSGNSEVGSNSPFSTVYGFTNGGGESDWAITGRAELKVAGSWDQFKDFTSFPGSDYACMIGAGGHVEQSDQDLAAVVGGNAVQGETTFAAWTIDLSVEGDGWNFFVAGNGMHTNNNLAITATGASADSSADDYGIVVQGGFFIPNTDWELFARYDVSFADADRTTTPAQDDDFSTVTLGTNWYWSGHAAKFTFDVQWFLDDGMVLSGPNTGIGYFQDLSDENEITLRFQFQFLF